MRLPGSSFPACAGGLGTHVENVVAAITGMKAKRVLAKLDIIVPGRAPR